MKVFIATVTLFLVTLLVTPINIVPTVANPQASTTVFLDPPTIKGTVIGENVTVNINVSNVTDLYGWQAGLTFNPDVLNCTGYYEGEFLKRGAGEFGTYWINRTTPWNNTKGTVKCHGCTLLGKIPGVTGSGQLGYLTFEVIGTGISDLHLIDVILVGVVWHNGDYDMFEIPIEVIDVFTVSWGGVDYPVETTSNLTGIWGEESSYGLFDHTFSSEEKVVTFDVITPHANFYNATIPKAILKCDNLSEWTVKVDGSPVPFVATESPTDTSLYFAHHNSTHEVEITGTVLGKPGDLNDDNIVDIYDLVYVAIRYGSERGKPPPPNTQPYEPNADVNGDGIIDIFDVVVIGIHYGATYQ